MIELKNLYIGYTKNNPLLIDFNYIFDKKIYAILGQSGCGKTTLLRTISGLRKPLSGEIIIDNNIITKPNKNVYMMHQSYTCFDWLNSIDNILIAKKIKGKVTKEDIDLAYDMLSEVKLLDHADKFPRQLSGGMRQRLALARTLFMKPDIILMDEPLSALDGETRSDMQQLILKLHKETNNTIIMVTHSLEEAELLSDNTLHL